MVKKKKNVIKVNPLPLDIDKITTDLKEFSEKKCPELLFNLQRTKDNIQKQLKNADIKPKYLYIDIFFHNNGDELTNFFDTFEGIQQMDIQLPQEDKDKLSYFYQQLKNSVLECELMEQKLQNQQIEKLLVDTKENIDNDKVKINDILDKLEGIGPTIIGMIVSLSVVTTLITTIQNIDVNYLPIFVLSTMWLGMTMIVFIGRWFQHSDGKAKENKWLYVIMSFFTIAVIVYTIFFQITNKDINENNDNCSDNTNISVNNSS